MKTAVLDIEVYSNYFLVKFKLTDSDQSKDFEMYDGKPFDCASVAGIMRKYRTVGFNSRRFDLPLIWAACNGASVAELKGMANDIIVRDKYFWGYEETDHIDIIEVLPGRASLKTYGGRIHFPFLQDLPIPPDAEITAGDRESLKSYCHNDLLITQALFEKVAPQIALREEMGKQYGVDLRSKSDAQIAEAVIKKMLGVGKVNVRSAAFKYLPPTFISFMTEPLRKRLEQISTYEFPASDKLVMPEFMTERMRIGKSEYQMGIGGLHSCENAQVSLDVSDYDVASYYPSIILNCGLYPKHLGEKFLEVYRQIYERRLRAKAEGDKILADTYKIVLNGSFGKFGSKYSALYSPELLIQTTITGQLALLMLIEMLEEMGNEVVSANTDGVVFRGDGAETVAWWEKVTGFSTERTDYKALYSRDVNNYFGFKEGGVKVKGIFVPGSLNKNPSNEIVTMAVIAFLKSGTPIEDTVRGCGDITKFLTLRNVKGGALFEGEYLGKVVRWYHSTTSASAITYKINGYLVPRSQGCRPLMRIAPVEDLNYDWYIEEAKEVLEQCGYSTSKTCSSGSAVKKKSRSVATR